MAFSAHEETPGWQRFKDFPYYNWNDDNYKKFMIDTLSQLEMRNFEQSEIIIQELDEVQEAYFVTKGVYNIGYNINKQKKNRL